MKDYIFGRDTISYVAKVEPKTVSSWYRKEINQQYSSKAQCNEYERGMAIALFRRSRSSLNQIAEILRIHPDSVRKFNEEVKVDQPSSDLIARTSDALVVTIPAVKKGFKEHGKKQYLNDRGLWPNPFDVFAMTWEMLDERFYEFLKIEQGIRCGVFHKNFRQNLDRQGIGLSWKARQSRRESVFPSKRLVGPHRFRGAKLIDDEFEISSQTDQARVVGRFVERELGKWMAGSKISKRLLCGYIPKEIE